MTTFKERIYKRTEVTPDRARERDQLEASNLICLRLHDYFDPASMEESNKYWTREAIEKMQTQAMESRPKAWKDIFAQDAPDTVSPIADSEKSVISAILANIATEELPVVKLATTEPKLTQNFAVFAPIKPHGNKVFIHGRDMFSSQAAESYFAPGTDKEKFPPAFFGSKARKKVSYMFSHDAYNELMFNYAFSNDAVESFNDSLVNLKAYFPKLDISQIPLATAETINEIGAMLGRALEAAGIEIGDFQQMLRFPKAHDYDEQIAKIRITTLQDFHHFIEQHKDLEKDYAQSLIIMLESHRYDPQIIPNFASGLEDESMRGKPLEDIIARGIERRTDQVLTTLAQQIDNPYDARFIAAEKQVADVIVHSVHPRVLHNVMECKTAIAVTDGYNIGALNNLYVGSAKDYGGKFDRKFPDTARGSSDVISLSAPNLDYGALAGVAAHEFEHHRDLTHATPFEISHRGEITPVFAQMRVHLDEIVAFFDNFDSNASPEAVTRLKEYAEIRGLKYDPDETNAENLLGIKASLQSDVRHVNLYVSGSFMAPADATLHDAYSTHSSQRNEVPAVMENVRKLVGKDFAQALLPRLHEIYLENRSHSDNLRYSSKDLGR